MKAPTLLATLLFLVTAPAFAQSDPCSAEVDSLGGLATLVGAAADGQEIEKKFLLPEFPPNVRFGHAYEIRQGYVFASPGELRVRQKGDKYYQTVKSDGDERRGELEIEIDKWVFDLMWNQVGDLTVEKTRYTSERGGLIYEVDKYHGAHDGLVTFEVEFPNAEAAAAFELPAWAEGAIDVTKDSRYKNKNLAKWGVPGKATRAFASRIVSFEPGEGGGYGDAHAVLGPPRGAGAGAGSLDVLSLGSGGQITLELSEVVVDEEGADFIVFENPFLQAGKLESYAEPGIVSVSADGKTWKTFKCNPSEAPSYPGCAGVQPVFSNADTNAIAPTDVNRAGGDAFDLADVGLSEIRFVRIQDAGTGGGTGATAGFDLDAVAVIHTGGTPTTVSAK